MENEPLQVLAFRFILRLDVKNFLTARNDAGGNDETTHTMSQERMPKEMRVVCLLGGMAVQTLFAGMVLSSIPGLSGVLALLLSLALGFLFSWLGMRSALEMLRLSEWMNGRETKPDRYWEVHDGFMLASTFGGPLLLAFIFGGMIIYGLARRPSALLWVGRKREKKEKTPALF